MTLGGLWHGASWTFVVWGLLHGAFLIVLRLYQEACRRSWLLERWSQTALSRAAGVATTFFAVSMAWVFFRSESFAHAWHMFDGLFFKQVGQRLPVHPMGVYSLVLVVVVAHVIGQFRPWREGLLHRLPSPAVGLVYAAGVVCVLILIPDAVKPFIYFQF
jgi:alginate O-acetyltransferase complex protein AlgI